MKRTIKVENHNAAKAILQHVYESDRSAIYQGAWQTKRYVVGSVVTATYDAKAKTVTLASDALHTEAGLGEYLPEEYRTTWCG